MLEIGPDKRARIHEYLRFRAAVKTDAGEIVVKNKDIQTKVTLDDKMFDPDPSVTYQEMGAMRHAGAAPAPPPPAEKKEEKK